MEVDVDDLAAEPRERARDAPERMRRRKLEQPAAAGQHEPRRGAELEPRLTRLKPGKRKADRRAVGVARGGDLSSKRRVHEPAAAAVEAWLDPPLVEPRALAAEDGHRILSRGPGTLGAAEVGVVPERSPADRLAGAGDPATLRFSGRSVGRTHQRRDPESPGRTRLHPRELLPDGVVERPLDVAGHNRIPFRHVSESYDPSKYDALAGSFAEATYADASRYFRRRLDLFRTLGPPVEPGSRVLELACGDGTFAALLVDAGFDYLGIDASEGMVEATRRRLGGDARVEHGDFNAYRPPSPVAATVCLNASYYARDRVAFFRAVAGYTEGKLFFDFIPREHPGTVAELRRAGFDRVALRPFFVPQSYTFPAPVQAGLELVERVGPLARLLLRKRFAYVCAAWRDGSA